MQQEHAIEVDAREVPCGVRVVSFRKSGLWFEHARPRRHTSLVVVHWTGAENPPQQVHQHLSAQKLSVHFVIDHAGIVWQMADANALCAHASGVNDRSVGIEVISRGSARGLPPYGVERTVYTERIHGNLVSYAGFTATQERTCIQLVAALCAHYELPMRVPMDGRDRLTSTALSGNELVSWRGVIGHLHVKHSKIDPGLAILGAIRQAGMSVG